MTREEQLDWLCRLRSEIFVYMPKEWLIPMKNALDITIKALEQEPKMGHWIDDEFGSKCSYCGIYTHLDKFDRPMKFKHCSMCGAKMESEE